MTASLKHGKIGRFVAMGKKLASGQARVMPSAPGVVARQRATRLMLAVSIIWFVSSWLQPPLKPPHATRTPHVGIGSLTICPPMVLSGDTPHYLVIVNSLIEDGDLDVSNNYDQALAGDWDAGARFAGFPLDRHIDSTRHGQQLSVHPPVMPMILAAFVFPLRGTRWVEPVCIWITMALVLLSIWVFAWKTGDHGVWAGLLALATPLWFYARDLWTEPWITAVWIGLLFARSPWGLAALALGGTMIRYPFVLVPMAMAGVSAWEGDRRRAWALAGGAGLGLVFSVTMAQWLFRDVGHFGLLHMGFHPTSGGMGQVVAPFDLPFKGMIGLLLDPEDGFLLFFPYLIWAFPRLATGFRRHLPVLVWFLFNASYSVWGAGSGFSSRYLVPAFPALILALRETRPRSRLFWVAVVWALCWGLFSGLFPMLALDRNMWGMVAKTWDEVIELWSALRT